ncbi:MAG: TrkH family potassium uptake protein [Oscillospiraceae bacterium]|nr:TrkH family potassium uptake protein [Oscillospiraceae bacterium]
MNLKLVGRTLGIIWTLEALFMLPSLGLAIYDREPGVIRAFLITIGLLLLLSGGLWLLCRSKQSEPSYTREGMVTVGFSWISMSALGCLPFCISGQIPSYVDALFEMVSGFTTTGASILRDVEALSRALLYWRSFSHWLGGMGMLVFILAVVPGSRHAAGYNLNLMRAESPGPSVSKLTPRMGQTAKTLYFLYFILTVLCVIFLLAGGMPLFDSLCTAFGTAGTGGFGIRNDSMAGYSPYLQNVCTVFMALFGVNFGVFYLLLLKQLSAVFRDEEVRMYFGILIVSTLLITLNIMPMTDGGFWASLRHAAFQVSSITTTTGFCTTDFNLWPSFSKAILFTLMIFGACAGSTGGGIKTARLLILMKEMRRNIRRTLRPRSVQTIRVNERPIDENVVRGVNAYMAAYWALILTSFILVSLDGFSFETNLSAVIACFNNIGPGFDMVGPAANYADFSNGVKLILTADMLLGRLELFPLLTLFSRYTWSRKL